MDAIEIYAHIQKTEAENEVLKARMEELVDIGQYRGIAIPMGVACKLIGISPKTMRGYATKGLLRCMPESTKNIMYFDAYEVLAIGRNKKTLRKRAHDIVIGVCNQEK